MARTFLDFAVAHGPLLRERPGHVAGVAPYRLGRQNADPRQEKVCSMTHVTTFPCRMMGQFLLGTGRPMQPRVDAT